MNQQGLRSGTLADPARKVCLPDGVPRVLETPYPFEVFQLPPGQVTFVHELNHQVRAIPLDVPLPPLDQANLFAAYGGHSSGHYEGDTLVIQSNGFNDQTFLDSSGLPHSDQLVTTERVRKIGGSTLRSIGHIARTQRVVDNDSEYVEPSDMLAELREDNQTLAARLREAHNVCEEHRDVASASLIEAWIDETERRTWFLFESSRRGDATGR